MDAFATLEEKVEQLIGAYRRAQLRVAELEEETRVLREATSGETGNLQQRVDALEAERSELRSRLEKLVATLDAIEL